MEDVELLEQGEERLLAFVGSPRRSPAAEEPLKHKADQRLDVGDVLEALPSREHALRGFGSQGLPLAKVRSMILTTRARFLSRDRFLVEQAPDAGLKSLGSAAELGIRLFVALGRKLRAARFQHLPRGSR